VPRYSFTAYFEQKVLSRRPYLRREWCIRAIEDPIRVEHEEDNRFRFWSDVPEMPGRFLRVVTLEDQVTIHNAFFDRRFKP
jgi:hypothetical protein